MTFVKALACAKTVAFAKVVPFAKTVPFAKVVPCANQGAGKKPSLDRSERIRHLGSQCSDLFVTFTGKDWITTHLSLQQITRVLVSAGGVPHQLKFYKDRSMKNLLTITTLLTTLLLAPLSVAEVWEDYGFSEEVTELTVVKVKPNYVDAYLTRLKRTWVSSMEIQKDMGVVMDYNVWAANVAAQPNVFLTVTYKNMGAMQGSKEGYEAMMKEMTERFNADENEQEELAQGYEDYREIVDYVILNRVEY